MANMSRRRSASRIASRAGAIPDPDAVGGAAAGDGLELVWVHPPTTSTPAKTRPSLAMRFGADPGRDDGLDAAADVEVTNYLHPTRLGQLRQVVEDSVDRALVEDAVVAEAPEVELETLELDTRGGRHICDVDRPEVGRPAAERFQLARVGLDPADGTQRSEFVAL